MNAPKCADTASSDFLVASPRVVSGTEAARVQPPQADPPAHDSFTRLLHRLEPDSASLWTEAAPSVERERGILVLDDNTLDKPYARQMALVTRHWSGTHRRVVRGINLLTLLWTDGERLIPIDDRLYERGAGWLDQERPLPGAADGRRGAGLPSGLRGLRQLVRQLGEPEGDPRPWLALADPAEEQPAGQPRRDRQPTAGRLYD